MQRSDFLDVRLLLDHITKQKAPGFSKASQIVVDGTYCEGFMIKTLYELSDDTECTHKIRIMPGRQKYSPKIFSLNDVNLPLSMPMPTSCKKKNLMTSRACNVYLI